MKNKLQGFILLLFSYLSVHAQSIDAIHMIPQNPTENDSITIYADLTFGSGSCNVHTQNFGVFGSDIFSSALHCVGSLAVICETTDTFQLGKLNPGTYHYYFQVSEGLLPSPCTPGIVPGPTDSITFTVGFGTGVLNTLHSPGHFSIFPNPTNNYVEIKMTDDFAPAREVSIYSMDGKMILSKFVHEETIQIQTGLLPGGAYLLEISSDTFREMQLLVVQHE